MESKTESQEDLLKNYSEMVYRLAFSQVKNRSDAEDVFQEVFLRLVKKKPTFESEEHCRAWLIRVTINCAKNVSRCAWFRHTVPLEDSPVFDTPEEKDVCGAVFELPPKYRAVIHLFYYQDMPVKQISEVLHLKESTVTSQLCRAREMLKQKLKGEFDDEN